MSRRARFRQADLARALKAAVDAGLNPSQVVIDPSGELRLSFSTSSTQAGTGNPLDRLLGNGS